MAGQTIGVDSVRIGTENFELVSSDLNPATRLTVSKTLTNGFELIFSNNLDDYTTTWIVVYKPRRNLEFRVASLDNTDQTIEVRHRFTFGPGGQPAPGDAKTRAQSSSGGPQETVDAVVIGGEPDETTARLRSLLELAPGRTFDFRKWLRDHERIRRFYIDAGYLTARVIPTRTLLDSAGGSKPRVVLEYRITRGPATGVVVTGWAADSSFVERLRMAWASTTFDQFAADDMSRVAREMLIDGGYVLPVVQTTVSETRPGFLLATVKVQTGPRVAKKAVTFEGMSVFSEQDLLALVATPGATDRAWRNPADLCLAISEAYAAAGYRGAVVDTGPVLVVGDIALLPVRIVEGQAAIAATERRLYQLGVFSAAAIRLEPVEATAREASSAIVPVRAAVSVVEPRRFQFVYGLEFSNAYGPVFENFQNAVGVAADVRDRNLLGRGMSLSFGGRYDPNIKSVRTLFTVPDLLFKTGGSQTVRGYPQEGLGAGEIQGIPIGGTRLLVLNQEFRVSVSKLLQGVVFADAGNAFGSEGIVWQNLAVGLGFGVRIRTPLVPLRLDFGFPIPRRPGDPTFRWYISVGQIF